MKIIVERDTPMKANEMAANMIVSHFAKAKSEKAVIEITDERHQTRSQMQNSLYWLWITELGNFIGYSKDQCALLMQDKFLGRDEFTNQAGTVEVSQIRGTSKLKVGEFAEYLEKVEIFSKQELDFVMPRPEDLYWQAMGVTD
jgi:predicted nucleotide-binding protein